ncbi:hypothetical protein [Planococcus sp. ISL-110]|uniref:hypothetical protein n=1 Tax=Planococcus sp. ISL-110 TaxID=2819167 RepID=UPI0020357E27|nr:hypothetical protein [Planococcus sp. ISL-110]
MSREDNEDLTDSNRIQTQLLYGEPVLIDEVVDGWAKVIARLQPCQKDERGYPGWVPISQLKKIAALAGLCPCNGEQIPALDRGIQTFERGVF